MSAEPSTLGVVAPPFDFYRSEPHTEEQLRKLNKPTGINFERWLEVRDKCRKDLFYLGTKILGRDLLEQPHQEVCDFFVQKNFDGCYHEGYTLNDVHRKFVEQSEVRERLLLYPRGSYKSTIDGLDIVQWLLNAPDIRILILTGEDSLGVAFLKEIKHYFYLAKESEPTLFHRLFPEYILTGEVGVNSSEFICPARQHYQVSPSVWQNSVTASLSGWHCDLIKGDDVITDRNSAAAVPRANVNQKYDSTFFLLDQWGFAESVGTRYAVDDWYGERLRCVSEESPIKVLCRPAWTPKPGYESVPLKSLTEEMVTLLFPEKLTFKALRKELMRNEQLFRSQLLNEPAMGGMAMFDPVVLHEHVIKLEEVPKDGQIFVAWDWASSSKAGSDYSAGAVGKVVGDTLYIIEVIYDRWRPSDLAYQIVNSAKRFNPRVLFIEEAPGSEFVKEEVRRIAYRLRYELPPVSCKGDRSAGAKEERIKGLQGLLASDRLYFVDGPWIDGTFLMFERWVGGLRNKGRKDDIPDAISMLQRFLPKSHRPIEEPEQKTPEEMAQQDWEMRVLRDARRRYLGYAPKAEIPYKTVRDFLHRNDPIPEIPKLKGIQTRTR